MLSHIFPQTRGVQGRAQTFGSLFRNNTSSGAQYQIKAQKLNCSEGGGYDQWICVCLWVFLSSPQQLKKGPPDWPSGLEVWSGVRSREETALRGFWAGSLKIFG